MEKHAYLNDLPQSLVMTDNDTVVIGKKTEVNGETRYIGQTVPAGELKKAFTELVLETADLPSHLEAMATEVKRASDFADESGVSAQESEASNQESSGHAERSRGFAQESEQYKNTSSDLQQQCQGHEETALTHANTAGRHAGDAFASEAKALEYTEMCEGFAGGLVSVLTMSISNFHHTIKGDGGIA